MDGEGTKRIPFKKTRSHNFDRSLYIVDVRKDAVVDVNVENRVSRALLCVHVGVTVNKHGFFWPKEQFEKS